MNKFLCTNQRCKGETEYWTSHCSKCGKFDVLERLRIEGEQDRLTAIMLSKVQSKERRLLTGMPAIDKLLGGGIVSDSVVLFAGRPGIGKSTITLQICDAMLKPYRDRSALKVLYASGEESITQIAARSRRLKMAYDLLVLESTRLEDVMAAVAETKPNFLIIDSIQTTHSTEVKGKRKSTSQVENSVQKLVDLARRLEVAVLLICQVTKDGEVAGPEFLQHYVDTILLFEGKKKQKDRTISVYGKNRYGSTEESVDFEMTAQGLKLKTKKIDDG